jgi:hypothetical protein
VNLPRYLSLGAGVQSSTVALMAEHGEIEPIDAAIFADVRAEPASVYAWLDWLETQLSYPVYRVSHGDLRENVLARVNRQKSGSGGPPFFTAGEAKEGMLPRQCTRDFKLDPIEKQIRALVGLKPRQRAPKEIVAETVLASDETLAPAVRAQCVSIGRAQSHARALPRMDGGARLSETAALGVHVLPVPIRSRMAAPQGARAGGVRRCGRDG